MMGRCDGKVRYESQAEGALASANVFLRSGERCEVYGCKECGGYHIGRRNVKGTPRRMAARGVGRKKRKWRGAR